MEKERRDIMNSRIFNYENEWRNTMNIILKNEKIERMDKMNNNIVNFVSGAIISPLFDKMCDITNVSKAKEIYTSFQKMYDLGLKEEIFSILHMLIASSGIDVPKQYLDMVDDEEFRGIFVFEAIEDFKDLMYDIEEELLISEGK